MKLKRFIQMQVFVLISTLLIHVQGADRLSMLEMKDKSNNTVLLLRHTYDNLGSLVSREVIAPDSFFFRKIISKVETDKSITESSLNFDDQSAGTVKYLAGTDKTTFSILDEFGEVILKGSWNGISQTQQKYDVVDDKNRGIAKLEYQYKDGIVSQISVLNANNEITHTIVNNSTSSKISSFKTLKNSTVNFSQSGKVNIQFSSSKKGKINCSLLDIQGKLITNLLNENFNPGPYIASFSLPQRSSKVGLLKVVINGNPQIYRVCLQGSKRIFAQSNHRALSFVTNSTASLAAVNNTNAWVSPITIIDLLMRNGDIETPSKPLYRSPGPMVVSKDKSLIYITEETAKRIGILDVAQKKIISEILLPNQPTGIALSGDGQTLFVTTASGIWPSGTLHYINTASKAITKTIHVGHSARSPIVSPDGSTIYVLNQYEDKVSVINVNTASISGSIPVIREPYSGAITPDGKTLLIANSLPKARAEDPDTNKTTSYISVINTQTKQMVDSLRLPMGSHSLFGTVISPDGKYAFVSHLVGVVNLIADKMDQGWVHTNNCAVVDLTTEKPKLLDVVTLDEISHGMANPWGIVCTEDNKFLNVIHSGSSEVSSIDIAKLINLSKTSTTPLYHRMSILQPMRRIFDLKGKSPRYGVAIDQKIFISDYFSDSIEVIDLQKTINSSTEFIALGDKKTITPQREGEMFFYDANLCLQKWQSCASCHPFTRPDALNWRLARANNTPKNVKSMLYSYYTPKMNWTGRRDNTAQSIAAGIEIELGLVPNERDIAVIDSFFKSLRPVPSPFLKKGRLSESATNGRKIYHNATKLDCILCHIPPLYFKPNPTRAFVPDAEETANLWDVPSLNESWRTGPYGHLGSEVRIEPFIKMKNHSGNVNTLSDQEFKDMVEYILSL